MHWFFSYQIIIIIGYKPFLGRTYLLGYIRWFIIYTKRLFYTIITTWFFILFRGKDIRKTYIAIHKTEIFFNILVTKIYIRVLEFTLIFLFKYLCPEYLFRNFPCSWLCFSLLYGCYKSFVASIVKKMRSVRTADGVTTCRQPVWWLPLEWVIPVKSLPYRGRRYHRMRIL